MADYETARSPFPRVLVWALVAVGAYVVISWIFRIASFLVNLIFFGFVVAIIVGIVAVIRSLSRSDR